MPITALPPAPSRDNPATFATLADAFVAALPTFGTEANALATEVNAAQTAVGVSQTAAATSATNASNSASAASTSAANAAAAVGGALWVSGTTYTAGALVYSPANGRTYRRLITGAGTTDPSADAVNWVALAVVAQLSDIGTGANEIPLNQYLGRMAYVDDPTSPIDAGTGITTGTGTLYRGGAIKVGGVFRTSILIDLTGLNSGGTANDIIGVNGASNCHLGQIVSWKSGTIVGGRMICLEAPAGGDTDIDLYCATESTGAEDAAITGLTETLLINAGVQSLGTVTYLSAMPADQQYLYFAGQGTTNATYTAGVFLIELFGV